MQYRALTSAGMLFVMPALAGLVVFVAIPFLLAIGLSFSNMRLGSPLPLEFVGAKQFIRLFDDPAFIRALVNNLVFTIIVVPLQTAGAGCIT